MVILTRYLDSFIKTLSSLWTLLLLLFLFLQIFNIYRVFRLCKANFSIFKDFFFLFLSILQSVFISTDIYVTSLCLIEILIS